MRKFLQFTAIATGVFVAVSGAPLSAAAAEVSTETWGTMPDGREVKIFTLENGAGTRVRLAEYGALLVSVETRDRDGRPGNITLSYDSLEQALAGGVYGSVIGRFANRIGGGGFTIDGKRYDLESVTPKTGVHIHGGKTGFHRQVWKGSSGRLDGMPFAKFTLTDPDGHEGYPGKVEAGVTYRLTAGNTLRLDYVATTTRPTHVNLTNHVYFNLAGTGDIRDHRLEMKCREVLAIDDHKIPTGELFSVAATPFDFREEKRIGEEIEDVPGGGYDHCFALPRAGETTESLPALFARLVDPASGRTLEVATTKPGVQVYTANHLKGTPFPKWGGICFETQFFPDTPNRPGFPSSVLRPGEVYSHTTEFRFGTEEE